MEFLRRRGDFDIVHDNQTLGYGLLAIEAMGLPGQDAWQQRPAMLPQFNLVVEAAYADPADAVAAGWLTPRRSIRANTRVPRRSTTSARLLSVVAVATRSPSARASPSASS